MTSIRQQIPNFIQGQTDQPDELKMPGQVREATNVLPDVTLGLIKRPGLQQLAELGVNGNGKWFNIFCENIIGLEEQYLCNITTDGQMFIWAAVDILSSSNNIIHKAGDPIGITFDTTPDARKNYPQTDLIRNNAVPQATPPDRLRNYLRHKKKDDLQVLTVNNYTFITNRQKFPTMAGNTASSRPHEAYVSLKQISYNRQYSLNISSPGGNASTETTATSVSVSTSFRPTSQKDCNGTFDEEFNFNSGSKQDLRVRVSTTCQTVPVKDDNYDSRYTDDIDLLFGGIGWKTGDVATFVKPFQGFANPWQVTYYVRVDSHSSITVYDDIAAIRPTPTPATGDQVLTGSTILGDVRNEINAISGFSAQIIGDGIYIKGNRAFQITTTEGDLWNILSSTSDDQGRYSTINNVANLPVECKHGYIVKVANSSAVEDDYYLKFFGNNNSDGLGVWEETIKPGILTNFNYTTMPHQLVRGWNSNNTQVVFDFAPVYWNQRTAGDDVTNPIPSFVKHGDSSGAPINKMLLYRNRLVMLSGDNVVLSQSGDLFNYFSDTALAVTPADPIDINCTVDSSSVLYDGLVVNNGMLLFSKFNQYLFTTDSDVLNSTTAKCTLIASYDFNTNSSPFSMASNVGFFSAAGNDSVFWEMREIYREGPPVVEERSKPVTRTLPYDLDLVLASKEDGLVLASTKGSSDVWCYRYFYSGNRQLQSSWFKWTIPGTMLFHFNNTRGKYWAVYRDGDKTRLMRLDLKEKMRAVSEEGIPYEYYVYLDNWQEVGFTWDPKTKTSSATLSWTPNPDRKLLVYENDTDTYRGRSTEPTVNGRVVTVPGNWQNTDCAVGYEMEMEVKFPHFFVQGKSGESYRSDTTANLTIHRVQMNFGAVGMYTIDLQRYGKDDYSMTIETTQQDAYQANRAAVYPDKLYTIPIYDRNTNCNITLSSKHPTPATLHSLTYEGDYTEPYYKRV